MAYFECESGSGGGGGGTLKDVYYNKVFNSSLTRKSLSVYSSRVTLSEGGWVDDTTHHIIYLYADFTVRSALGTGTNSDVLDLSNFSSDKCPYVYATSAKRGDATLTTDTTSTYPTKNWIVHSFTSSVGITLPYGQGAAVSDHYIVYGSWNY